MSVIEHKYKKRMARYLRKEITFFILGAGFASVIFYVGSMAANVDIVSERIMSTDIGTRLLTNSSKTVLVSEVRPLEKPYTNTYLNVFNATHERKEVTERSMLTNSGHRLLTNSSKTVLVREYKSTAKPYTKKYVNVFSATHEHKEVRESVSTHQCIPYRTRSGSTYICVHPREKDIWVSGGLLSSGSWEQHFVLFVANAVTTHSGMSFLDLGCNIGTFTVYLAKMGTRMVAVDASKENLLLLSRSLSLGKLHQNVTLVLNAMSDTHEYVTLQEEPTNKGGTIVVPSNEINPREAVQTIMLDELAFMFSGQSIFIKMDIESSEWKALNGGKQFFKVVDVRFVLLEFMYHRDKQSGKQICDFFTENGFRPYRSLDRSSVLNITKYQSWPDNVLWIKSNIRDM